MKELGADILRLVAATANRLRLMQIDFAEESSATREEYLLGELKSALAQVSNADRGAFLQALSERFPIWDNQSAAGARTPAPAAAAPADLQPPELCKALADKGSGLSQSQRAELLEDLRAAWGLPATGAAALPAPLSGDWRETLGLAATDVVDVPALPYVLKQLLDFIHTLDPLVTKAWTTVKPGAAVKKTDWQKIVTRFVRGERNATLARDLRELRQLAAALISTIPQLAYRFCQQHLARFRPEEIEEAVKAEGGGWMVSIEARCWKKYSKSLASGLEEGAVQQAMSQIISEMVESILKGSAKPDGE